MEATTPPSISIAEIHDRPIGQVSEVVTKRFPPVEKLWKHLQENMQRQIQERKPLTLAQLAVEEILTDLTALEVGKTRLYPDRANDGFGGMVVKRHSRHTLVFQREFYKGRSRWADTPGQARQDIATYLNTGKLSEPENIKGF